MVTMIIIGSFIKSDNLKKKNQLPMYGKKFRMCFTPQAEDFERSAIYILTSCSYIY